MLSSTLCVLVCSLILWYHVLILCKHSFLSIEWRFFNNVYLIPKATKFNGLTTRKPITQNYLLHINGNQNGVTQIISYLIFLNFRLRNTYYTLTSISGSSLLTKAGGAIIFDQIDRYQFTVRSNFKSIDWTLGSNNYFIHKSKIQRSKYVQSKHSRFFYSQIVVVRQHKKLIVKWKKHLFQNVQHEHCNLRPVSVC